ncbi:MULTISPECIES: DEAD/DEAH box helicase [unclassified Bradyrhizobium]|uniref:DEAD/DEAH box helicase n=1 Tax=unclassified Bradyrhizobium TaxID=2631580 RepID=UPI001CD41D17|nr:MULTISPECIES: DEAD/DEAH box helicase [unclassified Bradyrhizobium]MCA1386042.1 DEAD/DEAH box helicase [Bradyrhizobium sp. BRP05]MCA1393840.1 DEAD/DEAH box helicase [Bradyrhizobium sp. IC3123]MCA1423484.1 DEAD/DEAH box helicase [Bradyrhizobium sp. BRP23]MCA1430622.1 DEAD/DEAH box helicase [Bradyrhizobium sp. NBAIM16]MCA1471199.1 DEAD/DEAH box helicase [Bradyrhizobium sp. IC3195]
MSSPASASNLEGAYDKLHPTIRRWIWDQGWDELREIQARTIISVLDGDRDILIAASTAAGKTEAAFLPVLTSVADRALAGFSVLYISPLKALINDQFKRLDELCENMAIPVVKWHGDAPQTAKKRAMADPRGISLITPESIEAMFVRRPGDAKRLLCSADFIVVDELHSFLQGPRGLHVASLLRRIDAVSSRPARRIGLSATIGDLGQAAAWLRPTMPQLVEILEAKSDSPELRLQVRGYVEPPQLDDPDHAEGASGIPEEAVVRRVALDDIADHLYSTLRGTNNLVFGGSRRTVESTADRLRRRSEKAKVPNEFYPHHGSLSKTIREELENRLKDGKLPTTGICTSTLELGVDIGSVKSVAQIGAPRSLSSLRQRLGRTGRRRGTPSVLRIYIREPNTDQDTGVIDRLRSNTIRSVAVIRLLLEKFVEPAGQVPEVASTLVHQILSVIAERGGIRARPLYELLCGSGPFAMISAAEFALLLKHLGSDEIRFIEQSPDGTIMLANEGEAVVQSRNFFAVFESAEEWRLTVSGRTLGTLPISFPVHKDSLVVFAGQRWIVQDLDEKTNTLFVAPHPGGVVPRFERADGERLHDRLAAEMKAVYLASDEPTYLDQRARDLLAEGREAFSGLGLDTTNVLQEEKDVHVFLWRGSQVTAVFGAAAAMVGLPGHVHDLGLTLSETTVAMARSKLASLADFTAADVVRVSSAVQNITAGKFKDQVPVELARTLWGRQNTCEIGAIPGIARSI